MKTNLTQPREMAPSHRTSRGFSPDAPVTRSTLKLFGAKTDAMEIFRRLIICIIGCGSVGGRIASLLARMGIGVLILIDPKKYKPASLATHDIMPADIGESKAMALARRCKKISPDTRVVAWPARFEDVDFFALLDVDLFIMAPDLLSVEVAAAQRCLWLGRPLVQASVHGPTLTAQIRYFANARDDGGCAACAYGPTEWDLMTREVRFSCEGAANGNARSPADGPATNSPGALCSIAADLAAIQALRSQAGLGKAVTNTMLEYCGFTHRTVVSPLRRHPKCRLDHTTFARLQVDQPMSALSVADLARAAVGQLGEDAQIEIAGLEWVEFASCACAQPQTVRRFAPRACTDLGLCPNCTRPLKPLSFYTHSTVSAHVLGSDVFQPLNRLGVRRAGGILFRSGEHGVLIQTRRSQA